MATEIEVTRVDEAAAQRLADATGKVTYLNQNPWLCMGQSRMTTDREEAVAWGESVAFVPTRESHLIRKLKNEWQALGEQQTGDHYDMPMPKLPRTDRERLIDTLPEPQLRVVRVLEYRGPQDKMEAFLAHSAVTPLEPFVAGGLEIVEQIRTTERLCRWCGGDHLLSQSEDECSANPHKGRY